ncbi:MAG: hypothetical protein HETSPECPRED_009927 [Heterodermia speciosa]|uniref:Uncharacterized protein n=1 Tax=Heterodermia speciosa TaxID=116794 RepID=A0A8H3G6V1_9LECA|nr:MAG: hypothetical protein HETSPECPRED_009927 [Heterodermia speciosa]
MPAPGSRFLVQMAGLGAVEHYLRNQQPKPRAPPVPRKHPRPRHRPRAPELEYRHRPHGLPGPSYPPYNQPPRRRRSHQLDPHGMGGRPWIPPADDFDMRGPMPMPMPMPIARRPRPNPLPPSRGPAPPHPYHDPRQHLPPPPPLPRRGAGGPIYPDRRRYFDAHPYQDEDLDYGHHEDGYEDRSDYYSDEEIESRHYPTSESDFEPDDDFLSHSEGSWERLDPRMVRFGYGERGQGRRRRSEGRRGYGRLYYGDGDGAGGGDGGWRPEGRGWGGGGYGGRDGMPWGYDGGGYPSGRGYGGYGGAQDGYSEESY